MKNIYNILKPKDIAKLNAPTFCEDDTQTLTFLMKLILFTRKYPNLHSVIKVYIVQYPEEINKVIEYGYTPLHIAINEFNYTNIKTVKLLLKYKASTIIEDKQYITPLISAIYSNNIAVVKVLLEYGANVNRKGKSNGTPLGLATYLPSRNGAYMYKLLLEYDASVNIKDRNYYIIKDYVKYIHMLNTKN